MSQTTLDALTEEIRKLSITEKAELKQWLERALSDDRRSGLFIPYSTSVREMRNERLERTDLGVFNSGLED
jgi:hypothetical protein